LLLDAMKAINVAKQQPNQNMKSAMQLQEDPCQDPRTLTPPLQQQPLKRLLLLAAI